MTGQSAKPPGSFVGMDLTVPNADHVRDFYTSVVGWTSDGMDMGGYDDYFMKILANGENVAGICHTRGENADLPPVWMIYVYVEDLEASTAKVVALGGKLITPIKGSADSMQYCVIQDPGGAILALASGADVCG